MIDFGCVVRNKNLWIDLLRVKELISTFLENLNKMVLELKMMKFYFAMWFMKIIV